MTQEQPVDSPDTSNEASEMQSPVAITPASEFAKKRDERTKGIVLTLPSGVSVRVKRPSVNKLIATGHVPADVASVLMSGNAASVKAGSKEFGKLYELQKIVAKNAVIEPTVVDGNANYEAGEVSIEDFADDDLATIMLYVQKGVTDLAKFRP